MSEPTTQERPEGATLRDWLAFNIPCDEYIRRLDFSSNRVASPIDPDDPPPQEPEGYTDWRVKREQLRWRPIDNPTEYDELCRKHQVEWDAWYEREQIRRQIVLRYRVADMALKLR